MMSLFGLRNMCGGKPNECLLTSWHYSTTKVFLNVRRWPYARIGVECFSNLSLGDNLVQKSRHAIPSPVAGTLRRGLFFPSEMTP
jgi:hypothetical protein